MNACSDQDFKIWGAPKTSREFIYVDDLADMAVTIAGLDKKEFNEVTDGNLYINVGTGEQERIEKVAERIKGILKKECHLSFGEIGLVGPKNKCLNISRLRRIFPSYSYTSLDQGLERTISWYLENGLRSV